MDRLQSHRFMCTFSSWTVVLLCTMATFPCRVTGQGNPAFNNPDNDIASSNQFFFDSYSDCNGPVRELYGNKAVIKGQQISTTRLPPESCTIMLKSEGQFDGSVLDIQVISMNIREDGTIVAIYDGEGAQSLLMSYSSGSTYQQNRRNFQTSGTTATFIMTRRVRTSFTNDVEIRITPARGGIVPGYENDYGRDNAFLFDKFPQEAIVGMIGGFYALVLVVCIIVIILFLRHFKGLDKEWETHQLATIKTGSVFDARLTNQPSQAWSVTGASQAGAGPASQYSRGASTEVYSRKKIPPSEDGDSGVFYNEERFQTRRLMNEERNGAKPKYATTNFSYSEPEDAADNFKEKVITPRVRTARHRSARPPSYEEAVSEDESYRSSEEESGSDDSARKKSLSSASERSSKSRSSRSRSESDTPSESGSESDSGSGSSSDPESRRGRGAKARRSKKRSGGRHQRKEKDRKHKRRRDSDDRSGSSRTTSTQPAQRQQQQMPPQQMPPMPYGAYPPGQFVPVMAGPPPQFQPVSMVPGYPPPQYADDRGGNASDSSRNQVQPTDPPIYSYLVRRGYTPLDQRSTVTGNTGRSRNARPEEPDTRLDTGVDYMRR